jgi:hypothetical protein
VKLDVSGYFQLSGRTSSVSFSMRSWRPNGYKNGTFAVSCSSWNSINSSCSRVFNVSKNTSWQGLYKKQCFVGFWSVRAVQKSLLCTIPGLYTRLIPKLASATFSRQSNSLKIDSRLADTFNFHQQHIVLREIRRFGLFTTVGVAVNYSFYNPSWRPI